MKLTNDVELIDGLPIAYIKSMNALVMSDLHLGYESHMAKQGVFVPKVNLKRIIELIGKALKGAEADKIIVVGDIKNEFSSVDVEEFNELYEIIKFTKQNGISLILIKGNHDNFVERYREPFKLKVYHQEANISDYFFFHGEELPKTITKDTKMLIMGHEHPAISITEAIGKVEKVRCFLFGKYHSIDFLVLPATNYFASGTAVNYEPKEELLAPIFKHVDIDEMKAIAVGYGSTLDFGKISKLRSV